MNPHTSLTTLIRSIPSLGGRKAYIHLGVKTHRLNYISCILEVVIRVQFTHAMEVDLYLIFVALLIVITAWILDPIQTLLQLLRKMRDGGNTNCCSFADIPGPSGLPFVGRALHYIKNSTTLKEFLIMHGRTYFQQYGPIYKETIMGKTVVYISDPKDAETVYKAEGKYPKRVIPQFKAIEKYYKSKNMSLVSLVQL